MKIAAFADAHIGSYGKMIDAVSGLNSRILDTSDSVKYAIRHAEDCGAQAVLFAGDMFRTSRPTPTELIKASRALTGILVQLPIHMIPGNHDMPRSASESNSLEPLRMMQGVTLYNEPTVCNLGGWQIATLPYPNRSRLASILPQYKDLSPEDADKLVSAHIESILRGLAAKLDPTIPSVLLAHLSIDVAEAGAEGSIMAGRDITIPLHAIPEEFTFCCFGHIHKAQDFSKHGRPNVFYTGSTDRIDFGEEGEEKSYVMMDLDAGTWERIPIPCREYATIKYWQTSNRGDAWADELTKVEDAICRIRIKRDESFRPDYDRLQKDTEDYNCFDFRGFVEDVQRVTAVRSEEIVTAQSTQELLKVWHTAKDCKLPIEELLVASDDIERTVA